MSKEIKGHLPCPSSNCGSSDAFSLYDDGHGYCHACKTRFEKNKFTVPNETVRKKKKRTFVKYDDIVEERVINRRGISRDTYSVYGIHGGFNDTGNLIAISYPYGERALKIRGTEEKTFYWKHIEDALPLFGMDKFPPGYSKYITITEGEEDAPSVFQMMGSKYASVSVMSSSQAAKNCKEAFDYLNSFERIYLCLDNDDNGRKASYEIARMFPFNKVYFVELSKYKDANEYLTNGETKEFNRLWWAAQPKTPEGFINSFQDIRRLLTKEDHSTAYDLPFPTLQEMTYGLRTGQVYLFTALEGVGKTEILRAIEYKVLKDEDCNMGIIHLEEPDKRSVYGLVGYDMGQPIHLPDHTIHPELVADKYEQLVKRDDRIIYYTNRDMQDINDILNAIRFMVVGNNCKVVFFDHINLVVSGMSDENERNMLDRLSTQLELMVEELDFCLVMVAHVNDVGLTRGSRNISKCAHTHIHMQRDKEAANELERNTTRLSVRKNRFAGRTGYAGDLLFDHSTFRVEELSEEKREEYSIPPA